MSKKHQRRTIAYLQGVANLQRSELGAAAFYTLDRIDSKTGSLLTHVSIMIAILIMTWTRLVQAPLIQVAVMCELIVYLIVTLGCLRSIYMSKPGDDDFVLDKAITQNLDRVARRLGAYRFSLFATIFTTIAFVATLGAEAFADRLLIIR